MSLTKNLVEAECGGQNPLVTTARHLNARQNLPSNAGPSHVNMAGEFLNQLPAIGSKQLSDNFKIRAPVPMGGPLIGPQVGQMATQWTQQYQNRWASEFIPVGSHLSNDPILSLSQRSENLTGATTSTTNVLASRIANMRLAHSSHQQHHATEGTASSQLEAKAKIDLESKDETVPSREIFQEPTQLEAHEPQSAKTTDVEDEQDLDFWQNLAEQQGYDPSNWFNTDFLRDDTDVNRGSNYVFDDMNPFQDQVDDPMAEGLKRLELGDIPSAVLLFEAAVQQKPDNCTAWRYLGTTQAQNENDVMAIKALETCVQLDKNDMDARMALAISLSNETQHRRACQELFSWIKRHPKYRHLLNEDATVFTTKPDTNSFAKLFVGEEEYNKISNILVEAARLFPDNPDPDIQCALGVIFNMRGQYSKAADCFKAALSVQPNDSILWNRLGAVQANGSCSEEAVSAYKQALKLSPGFLRSRYNLAISCIQLNAYKEAAEQLITILNIQAAGRGLHNSKSRSLTSTNVWNTLRTVTTLMNRPDLYKQIDMRQLDELNKEFPTRCWPDGSPSQCKSCSLPGSSSDSSTATSSNTR